jgi:hypothetical protein
MLPFISFLLSGIEASGSSEDRSELPRLHPLRLPPVAPQTYMRPLYFTMRPMMFFTYEKSFGKAAPLGVLVSGI